MEKIMNMRNILKEAQGNKTKREFAKELGVSDTTLINIYKGRRGVGKTVLAAMIRHPDTREATLKFLSENSSLDIGCQQM